MGGKALPPILESSGSSSRSASRLRDCFRVSASQEYAAGNGCSLATLIEACLDSLGQSPHHPELRSSVIFSTAWWTAVPWSSFKSGDGNAHAHADSHEAALETFQLINQMISKLPGAVARRVPDVAAMGLHASK